MGVQFADFPCLDPISIAEHCRDNGLPTATWLGRANSFTCPLGTNPGYGYLLMRRGDLDEVDFAESYGLEFTSEASGDEEAPGFGLDGVQIITANCITPGLRGDPDCAYLVRVADARWPLQNTPIDKAYNLRCDPDNWYLDTLQDDGSLWDWDGMLEDLWSIVFPDAEWGGLPDGVEPDGQPEGFNFYGGRALKALGQVLERIGCTLILNVSTGGGFGIVEIGDATEANDADDFDEQRVFDADYLTSAASLIPATVRVYFPNIYAVADCDGGSPWTWLDVTGDSLEDDDGGDGGSDGGDTSTLVAFNPDPLVRAGNDNIVPGGTITQSGNPNATITQDGGDDEEPEEQAGTYAILYDELPALYDLSGSLVNSDELESRANYRATIYYNQAILDRVYRAYAHGLTDIPPNSMTTATRWSDTGRGLVTEVSQFPGLLHRPTDRGRDVAPSDSWDYVFEWLFQSMAPIVPNQFVMAHRVAMVLPACCTTTTTTTSSTTSTSTTSTSTTSTTTTSTTTQTTTTASTTTATTSVGTTFCNPCNTGISDEWTFTAGGIIAGSCGSGCLGFNGPWVLVYNPTATAANGGFCVFDTGDVGPCQGGVNPPFYTVGQVPTWSLFYNNSNAEWFLQNSAGTNAVLAGVSWNCLGPNTLTVNAGGECAFSGTPVNPTVTPVM